ncbi:MAG: sulfatase-like hydrolase/transferase [Phycisphaera sp.]|nr:sulfatase-like hydrolase/transferase [Phycisphaera sp.]
MHRPLHAVRPLAAAITLVAALVIAAAIAPCIAAEPPAPARPNVLFIITDQQFADAMSCRMGDKWIHTPNMDRLAAAGMLYTRAYAANPLCKPSRAAMFTGHYAVQTGIESNKPAKKFDFDRFTSLGRVFADAGYDTGYIGKWHLPWATSKNTDQHGFAVMQVSDDDEKHPPVATKFIRAKRDKPWLLVLSMLNPHNICQWSRDQKLPNGPIGDAPPPDQCPPAPANLAPCANEPPIMAQMRDCYHASTTFPVGDFSADKWRQYRWAYYRLIEKVDAQLGPVLDALHDSGQDANTLIVFTADHGECAGAHGWNQKTVMWEESARVPFIVVYPGVVQHGVSDQLVNTGVDIMPTLCDFAGVKPPADLPGMSLKGDATGNADATPKRSFIVVSDYMAQGAKANGVDPHPHSRMLRTARYKYWVLDQGDPRELLFDMEKDPGETINLAPDPAYAATLKELRAQLRDWCTRVDDRFDVPADQ